MTLKVKLFLLVISCTVFGFIISIFAMNLYGKMFFTGYNHQDLTELAETVRTEAGRPDGGENLPSVLAALGRQHPGVEMEWFRQDGTLLYSSPGRTDNYSFGELMNLFAGQPYALWEGNAVSTPYPVSVGGETTYLLFTLRPEALQSSQVYLYFSTFGEFAMFMSPILLFLFTPAAVSFIFVGYVNRRIQRLNRAMQLADLNRLEADLQDSSPDEIGQLARLFVQMSRRINSQFLQIRHIEENRKRLVSNISHDLRTPLTSILGYAETISSEIDKDTANLRRWSDIIVQRAVYMEKLLKQLFEISMLENQHLSVYVKPCNYSELVRGIITEYVPVIEERGYQLDLRIPERDIWWPLDAHQMERVVRNLIDNALKYGASGSYVGIRLAEAGELVLLSVEDRGEGIPADERERIFEPFHRLSKARQSDGMGLGLSIAAEIVFAHKGTIHVTSEPKRSTVFTVRLPKEQTPEMAADAPTRKKAFQRVGGG